VLRYLHTRIDHDRFLPHNHHTIFYLTLLNVCCWRHVGFKHLKRTVRGQINKHSSSYVACPFTKLHPSESNTERRSRFVLKWMGDSIASGPVQTRYCLWGTWLLSINDVKEYIIPVLNCIGYSEQGTCEMAVGQACSILPLTASIARRRWDVWASTALFLSNPNFHTKRRAVIASSPGRFTPWRALLVPTGQTTWPSEQKLEMLNPEVGNYFNLRFKMVYFEMAVGSITSQIQLRRPT
jgi:hypothetical protein